MNRFSDYSVEQSGTPKGWLLVSRRAGNAYVSMKIRPDLLGIPGAQGLPGLDGPTGQPGAKGPTGSTGTSGNQGPAGPVGVNGAAGVYPEEVTLWDSAAFDSFEQYADGATLAGLNGGLGFAAPWAGSGSTIVTRTNADGTTEKRLRIAGGFIARRFPWGSNWNSIEITFAARVNRPSGIAFGNNNSDDGSGYFIGACSGQTFTAASPLCLNFYGQYGQTVNTFTLVVGTQNSYFRHTSGGRQQGGKILGVDTPTPTFGSSFPTFSSVEGRKSIYVLTINRGAFVGANPTTYSVTQGNGLFFTGEFDYPKQTLMESYCRRVNLAENLSGGFAPETSAQAWDESTGILDSLNISWPWSIAPLEISSIGVRRVY